MTIIFIIAGISAVCTLIVFLLSLLESEVNVVEAATTAFISAADIALFMGIGYGVYTLLITYIAVANPLLPVATWAITTVFTLILEKLIEGGFNTEVKKDNVVSIQRVF